MVAENTLLNIPALTAPTADNVIIDYMGGAFPSKPDTAKTLSINCNCCSSSNP